MVVVVVVVFRIVWVLLEFWRHFDQRQTKNQIETTTQENREILWGRVQKDANEMYRG